MALVPLNHFPTTFTTTNPKPYFHPQIVLTRRSLTKSLTTSSLLLISKFTVLEAPNSIALDLSMTVPDQTTEQAESSIRAHAESLLGVKTLLESSPPEEWKEAQKALRKRASYLKQDLYTIIQSKAGIERPRLRKLYSDLFNGVTRMDYAARDRDEARVWEFYGNVVEAVHEILSRI
ncbi:hypothetical protein LOK49_LG04G01837 [Camellia lanceoleosa]|uniref:Uncharacterized protein n=1 Tax=Camellia lanceoleosa TaxID=1840588 RepID=A0ACC0I3B5_9ERIC|nr:hypothetical protein LOK49_LG04G01837 [Camellia lanceoleosa]